MNEMNSLAAFADIYEQMERINRRQRRANFHNTCRFAFSLACAWAVYSVLKDEIKELKKEKEEEK